MKRSQRSISWQLDRVHRICFYWYQVRWEVLNCIGVALSPVLALCAHLCLTPLSGLAEVGTDRLTLAVGAGARCLATTSQHLDVTEATPRKKKTGTRQ